MAVRIGSEFLVNTGNTYGPQVSPDVAGAADGGFVVVWSSAFHPSNAQGLGVEIQARAFLPNQPLASEFLVNTITLDPQFSPTVTARPDGSFAIAYSSGVEDHLPGTSVNTQYLDAHGAPTGPEYLTDYSYYHSNPETASFADGTVVTIWGEEFAGEGEIRSASGSVRSRFEFGWDSSLGPKAVAVLSDTSFVVAWYGYRDEEHAMEGGDTAFYAQVRQRSGLAEPPFKIDAAVGGRPDPSIALLSNGNFVVVWTDGAFTTDPASGQGADVKARIYAPDGQPLGEAFTVNTGLIADQFNADVAALSDGRFVVVWENGVGDPDVPSPIATIQGQIFAADGTRQGEEFQVNARSDTSSGEPSVTSLGADRFAVSWLGDEGIEGADGGIKVQVFAADNAPDPETITGTGGNDRLTGGFANDLIRGGKGADTAFGGFGDDRLLGEKGEDALYGGEGRDTLTGGWQSDRLYGEIGDDTLYGDLSVVGAGSRGANDLLFGGEGDDILYGDAETISAGGHGGNDVLRGGDGNDRIYGDGASGAGVVNGGGDDSIDGGWGNDELWGGGGNDRFLFQGLTGSDIIWDFGQEPGNNDVIDLRRTDAGNPDNGSLQIDYVNGNAELHFNGGFIKVMGVANLDPSDVLF
jgi:hypothetical protein